MTAERYDRAATPFSELVPWMMFIRPDLVLNKDGTLLVCYDLRGIDIENIQEADGDRHASLLEHGLRMFDEHVTLWWTVDRRRSSLYPDGRFPDPVSAFIDQEHKATFAGGAQYRNEHRLAMLYSPDAGSTRFMDRMAHFTMLGHKVPGAAAQAVVSMLSKAREFAFDAAKLDRDIGRFEEMLTAFDETVRDCNLTRLRDDPLRQYLHDRCSPASAGQSVAQPAIDLYLDGWLPDNTLHVGRDVLLFDHNTPAYVAAASVKDWPRYTHPGVLDDLLRIPAELSISQCFRFVDPLKAKKVIEARRKHNLNAQKGLLTYLSEALTNTESERRDEGRVNAARDSSDALAAMTTEDRLFGYYNLTVLAYGESAQDTEESIKMVTQALNHRGFIAVREKIHLLSAWAGSLPGQWSEIVRWFFVNTGNLADLAPIRTLGSGDVSNRFLSEQTQRRCPALTAFSTEWHIPFYFNFHHGDLAHTLVVGPSRAGKSVFNNFLIAQFRKYHPCRIFIFDKDYSCQIPTLLQGGQHVDMSGDSPVVRLNPLHLLSDRNAWSWLAQWLELLLCSRLGRTWSAADDESVWRALESTAARDRQYWRLQTLHPFLSKELSEQLAQWTGTGSRARYFDNEEDSFNLADFTDVEMGGLFQDERVAASFLDYAFYRIRRQLDGTPTLIYIEEAWFMLAHPRFAERINDWLRTLAKKNAFLIMATQSLDELARSDIFATIIDNIPNKIFLPNSNALAHEALYTGRFGLNREQVERIRSATPKSQYYIVTPHLTRLAVASFSDSALACLRSDSRARELFAEHYARREGNEHWIAEYVDNVVASRVA